MFSETEQSYAETIEAEIARYLDGVTDKADIDPVTHLAAKLRMDASFDRAIFAEALIKVLPKLKLENPNTWYCIELLIVELEVRSDRLVAALHEILEGEIPLPEPLSKYRIWRSIEVAQCGLTPADLAGDAAELKAEAPGLWFNLLLLANAHNNPMVLTKQIVELVKGRSPLLSWKDLRAKLPELRKAYGSGAEFRRQVKTIAEAINDFGHRTEFLKSVDRRLGTEFADMLASPIVESLPGKFATQMREMVARPAATRAKRWKSASADQFELSAA